MRAGTPARITVVPCGFEVSTTFYQGTRFGPRRLLEASTEMELFDLELGFSPWDGGITTLEEPPLSDSAGPVVDALASVIGEQLDAGLFPLLLGGEHTVAVGGARAVAPRVPGVGFLHVDAHADYRFTYHDNPLNHACAARRLSELGPVVMAGIRSVSAEEWDELRASSDIAVFPAHELRERGWQARVVDALPPVVYLTLDLDGLDPSVIPGVGNPEPGGIGWNEFIILLHELFENRRVVGADICELRPIPGSPQSESAAARIAQRICGLHLRQIHGR
jgi:agmatinase